MCACFILVRSLFLSRARSLFVPSFHRSLTAGALGPCIVSLNTNKPSTRAPKVFLKIQNLVTEKQRKEGLFSLNPPPPLPVLVSPPSHSLSQNNCGARNRPPAP